MKQTVVILATGGTIAGIGEEGKTAGYQPGTLTADDLIRTIPEIMELAEIETIQICNINSDDMTSEIWIDLANTINRMAERPEVAGFVVTHGTDTMEETAYFLNLTVKTDKPVVLTGSIRPSTAISADGPINMYDAVCVASSEEAKGHGVLVVFSDRIFSARSVSKASTYHVTALSSGELGSIGVIRDGKVFIYETPTRLHTVSTEFSLTGLDTLPKVAVIYFSVDSDPEIIRYAAEHTEGIVIAGAGAGEFSEQYKEVIDRLSVPVVVSSRVDNGIIVPENLLCRNTVAANNLSPQKAAILLRLAIAKGAKAEDLQRMFDQY